MNQIKEMAEMNIENSMAPVAPAGNQALAIGPDGLAAWQRVWRRGVAVFLSDDALNALAKALDTDDKRLIQNATTIPAPLQCVQDWPVEAACAIGYCGWQGENLPTVGEVEEYFARLCFEVDQLLAEPGGCRYFLNWFDDTPRESMRASLLTEVLLEQRRRNDIRAATQLAGSA